jgi:hypothetical protein
MSKILINISPFKLLPSRKSKNTNLKFNLSALSSASALRSQFLLGLEREQSQSLLNLRSIAADYTKLGSPG